MNIREKLLQIQTELKAPKSQYNKFGNFNYRNCEDILEAVKPLCEKHKAVLVVSDKVVSVDGWHYIEATAELLDCEKDVSLMNKAYARESEAKAGMDSAQITGSTSSYARKYALNGLFSIDDTKDPDTDEHKSQQEDGQNKQSQKGSTNNNAGTKSKTAALIKYLKENGLDQGKICESYKAENVDALTDGQIKAILDNKNFAYFKEKCGV